MRLPNFDYTRPFYYLVTLKAVEGLEPFVIMPDHVHFIIKLRKAEKMLSLPRLVWLLARDFSRSYWECG